MVHQKLHFQRTYYIETEIIGALIMSTDMKALEFKKKLANIVNIIFSWIPKIILIITVTMVVWMISTHHKLLYILSPSMEPTIMTGQFVLAKEVNADDCTVGDIATYKRGNITVTHRIINETDDQFEFKGDNNDLSDGYIDKDLIMYKIVRY